MTEISGVLYLDLGEDNMSIYNGQNSANNIIKSVHFTIGKYILIKFSYMLYYIH